MKKQWFRMAAATLLVMLLVGCGASGGLAGSADSIRLGLSMASRDDFLIEVERAAVGAATEAEVALDSINADGDQQAQLAQIEAWADEGYAAAIVVLCEAAAAGEVLDRAGTMPVVFLNRQPEDLSVLQSRANVLYIGSPEQDAGQMQGEFLAEYFLSQPQSGVSDLHSPRIAVIEGDTRGNASAARIAAAKQAMTDAGLEPVYLFEQDAGWQRSQAQELFAEFLKETPEIDAVLAANDAMGLGASDALAQAGYAIASIPIVGVDATAAGRAAIRDGRLNFTVFQDAQAQGAGAVEAAMRMLGGTPLDQADNIQWIAYHPVDASNIDQLFPDDR